MRRRTIDLQFQIYGKAPRKYGPLAYKVGSSDCALLVKAGWTHVGSGRRNYRYVVPPQGTKGCNPIVSVKVPTDDEVRAIAQELHAEHEQQIVLFDEFLTHYYPAGGVAVYIADRIVFEQHRPWGEHLSPEIIRQTHSKFSISGGPWSIELIWDQGDDQPPTWRRHEAHVVNERAEK